MHPQKFSENTDTTPRTLRRKKLATATPIQDLHLIHQNTNEKTSHSNTMKIPAPLDPASSMSSATSAYESPSTKTAVNHAQTKKKKKTTHQIFEKSKLSHTMYRTPLHKTPGEAFEENTNITLTMGQHHEAPTTRGNQDPQRHLQLDTNEAQLGFSLPST